MSVVSDIDRELVWDTWLAGLSPWEIHWLCQHQRELTFHDDFVSGELSIENIEGMLTAAFASSHAG